MRVKNTAKIRQCKVCLKDKNLEEFQSAGTPGSFLYTCKICYRETVIKPYQRRWRAGMSDELREKRNAENMDRYTAKKKICFAHYGNICECCAETEEMFLSIDHVNNDGAEHRKNEVKGNDIYAWLIKNNFPDGFRLLCHNCNMGRHRNGGICPHQEGSSTITQVSSRKCGEAPDTLKGNEIVKPLGNPRAVLSPTFPWGFNSTRLN